VRCLSPHHDIHGHLPLTCAVSRFLSITVRSLSLLNTESTNLTGINVDIECPHDGNIDKKMSAKISWGLATPYQC
jgi:hypothetical protein